MRICCSTLVLLFVLPLAHAGAQSSALAAATQLYQTGNFGPVVPAELKEIKRGDAIPVFERRFPTLTNPDLRARWAAELVRLGDKDSRYWDLLADTMAERLNSDVTDHEPKDPVTGKPLDPQRGYVVRQEFFGPLRVSPAEQDRLACQYLELAQDARALPLLRRALEVPRESLWSCAARTLAGLNDTSAIPQIVALIERAEPERRSMIAQGLLGHDAAFTAAAKPFIPELNTDALSKFKAGDEFPFTLEQLATGHVTEAIPLLEARFVTVKDLSTKDKIASVLARLQPGNPVYWNYVLAQARAAVESDAPFPYSSAGRDAQGKLAFSPEFELWAQKHHINPANGDDPFYQLPGFVMELAEMGDARAIPLLRQGLLSQTPLVQSSAAMGLAQIPDKGSIPLILAACKRSPWNASALVMFSLSHFDDDEAQAAVRQYLPDNPPGLWDEVKKSRGTKPFDAPTSAKPQP